MKRSLLHAIAAILFMAIGVSAGAADIYKGSHYQGIGKIKGQPVDVWIDMVVDDGDLDFNMANSINCTAEYTVSGQGANPTLTIKMPGSGSVPLKTTDGGLSLTGKLTRMGQQIDLWLLKIPTKLTASSLPDEKLDAIVGSSDGYTAFVIVDMPDGQKMCVTSDFSLSSGDHSFKLVCDSPAMQKIFSKCYGSYKVVDGGLVLTDATGVTTSGKILDDGTYITVPMGSAQGMKLTLILIR